MEKATAKEKVVTKESRREKANSSCKIRVATASKSTNLETAVGGSKMNGMNLENNEKENGERLVCSGKVPKWETSVRDFIMHLRIIRNQQELL